MQDEVMEAVFHAYFEELKVIMLTQQSGLSLTLGFSAVAAVFACRTCIKLMSLCA